MTQPTFQNAVQHHQAGRLTDAEKLYRQVLAQQPAHADAWHRLGGVLAALGKNDEAADAIRHALALRSNWPEAHSNLGNVLRNLNRLDEAVAACRQALALKPDYAIAYNNLANALKDQGQLTQAIAAYQRAITLNPNYAKAHANLGLALQDAGQLPEAITAYRRALALNPNTPDVQTNLAHALRHRGQLDEAIAAYRQAIALQPDLASAHNDLGIALREKGLTDQALAAYRHALALQPDYAEAHNNLANALTDLGHLDEALAAYRQALALKPDYVSAHSNLLFALLLHPAYDAPAIAREHRAWNLQHATHLQQFIQPHLNDRSPTRRLRIGYVSPRFNSLPEGRFLLPLLTHHDRAQFEIFAYSQVPFPDAMTQRLRAHTDTWRNLVGLSDDHAADLIRQDRIDILVDLAMHSGHNRLLVFARKPAPVQVTYLAYASTTGLATIDYRLSDPYLDPPSMDESIYTEKTLRLPETYWCFDPPAECPAVNPLPALTRGHITFGCLAKFYKITPPALAAWAHILQAVPTSHLLLHASQGPHRQEVLDLFQRHGIDPTRIHFAPKVPLPEYFQSYHTLDLILDTFPYAGGTTTCDALYMGVPVITLAGPTAVSRAGSSLLSNVGAPELIAHSPEEYIHLATTLAQNLPRLTHLRATLRPRMEQSPLMNAPRFTHHLEAAYRHIWETWCNTPPPQPSANT